MESVRMLNMFKWTHNDLKIQKKYNLGKGRIYPALQQAGHKYLSPNFSLKAAWTGQRKIGWVVGWP